MDMKAAVIVFRRNARSNSMGSNAEASEVVPAKEASPLSIAAARKGVKVKRFFLLMVSSFFR